MDSSKLIETFLRKTQKEASEKETSHTSTDSAWTIFNIYSTRLIWCTLSNWGGLGVTGGRLIGEGSLPSRRLL
jgi:hypothetical protein